MILALAMVWEKVAGWLHGGEDEEHLVGLVGLLLLVLMLGLVFSLLLLLLVLLLLALLVLLALLLLVSLVMPSLHWPLSALPWRE